MRSCSLFSKTITKYIYMKSRFRIRKFTLARLILLSLGLMNTFAAFSKSKDVTFLVNGVSCQLEQGVLKVEFVTSDIVRVQYTGENVFKGNSTGICMPHVTRPVRFTSGKEIDSCVLKSDSLAAESWRKEGDGACRIRRTIQTY